MSIMTGDLGHALDGSMVALHHLNIKQLIATFTQDRSIDMD
jgi:hypothetical protein